MDTPDLLAISRSLDDLLKPVQGSTRLKFKSVAVSTQLLCLGGSTGSVYIYDRQNLKLIKFVSNKVGSIILMKFSHSERILAVADSNGLISCWEVDGDTQEVKMIKEITDYRDQLITSFCWNDSSTKLYVGDQRGVVMKFSVSLGKVHFTGSSGDSILKTGVPIVQMDFCKERLLISTTNKALLCFTDRSKFQQIGTKPRDGVYGVCFLQPTADGTPVIYSARPGSRLWEVDFSGRVLSTHQFKELLAAPPKPIINCRGCPLPDCDGSWSRPQAFNFPALHVIKKRYMLTWSSRGVYIINSPVASILQWSDQIKSIQNVCCHESYAYVLHADGAVTELQLMSLKECFSFCYQQEEWKHIAMLAFRYRQEILTKVEFFLTIDFSEALLRLLEMNVHDQPPPEVLASLKALISGLDERHMEIRAQVQERLNQGIANPDIPSSDSGVEDNDEVKSNASETASEGSGRKSSSKRGDVNLDSLVQKATAALVTKVVASGFMRKTIREVLHSEGVLSDYSATVGLHTNDDCLHKILHTSSSMPSTPRAASPPIQRSHSVHGLDELCLIQMKERSHSDLLPAGEASALLADFRDNGGPRESADVAPLQSSSSEKKLPTRKKKSKQPVRVEILSSGKISAGSAGAEAPSRDQQASLSIESDRYESQEKVVLPVTAIDGLTNAPREVGADTDSLNEESKSNSGIFFVTKNASRRVSGPFLDPVELVKDTSYMQDDTGSPLTRSQIFALVIKKIETSPSLINNLVNITAITRGNLRDQRVLYNVKSVQGELRNWAAALRDVARDFHAEVIRNVDFKLQRHMNPVLRAFLEVESYRLLFAQLSFAFSEISNVAMLCCQSDMYTDACESIKPYEAELLLGRTTLKDVFEQGLKEIARIRALPDDVVADDGLKIYTQYAAPATDVDSQIASDVRESDMASVSSDVSCKDGSLHNSGNLPLPYNRGQRRHSDFDLVIYDEFSARKQSSLANDTSSHLSVENSAASAIALADDEPSGSDAANRGLQSLVTSPEFSKLCMNFESGDSACSSCYLDQCRACFILRYFAVLDFSMIRSLLLWKGGCCWRTWNACMAGLKDTLAESKLSKLIASGNLAGIRMELQHLSSSQNPTAVLAFASSLHHLSPKLLANFLDEGSLKPWEVALLFCSEKNLIGASSFFAYAKSVLADPTSGISKLFLKCVLSSCLEECPGRPFLYCECGRARPGSNRVPWKYADLIDALLRMTCARFGSNVPMLRRFALDCRSSGYWLGYLYLAVHLSEMDSILALLVQLKDFACLQEFLQSNHVILTDEHWASLFRSCMSAAPMDSNNHTCTPAGGSLLQPIAFNRLAVLAVSFLGARGFLKLVTSLSLPRDSSLSTDFYCTLVRVLELENKQYSIVSRVIEAENNKMWSDKKTVMSFELEAVKNAELAGKEFALSPYPKSYEEDGDDFEKGDACWGRSINISSADCPVCTLPLCIKSTSSSGLILFQCGHCFHKTCVSENACITCYYQGLSSLA